MPWRFGTTMSAKFDAVDARFDGLVVVTRQGFEQVDKRFERLESRVDNLDRDVQAITRRFWHGPNT